MTLRFPELHPIPQPNDYHAAYDMYDQEVKEEGGVWVEVMRRSTGAIHSESLKRQQLSIAEFGLLLEPVGEEGIQDKYLRRHHAFARGYFQQFSPLTMLYQGKIEVETMLDVAHDLARTQKFGEIENDEDRHFVQRQYVESMGMYGLSIIGEPASHFIDNWAQEIYPDSADYYADLDYKDANSEDLRKIYALGHGLMVMCGIKYQEAINDTAVRMIGEVINFEEEAGLLGLKDTGE